MIAKSEKNKKIIQELAPYLNLGWQLVATIVLMVVIGYFLDKFFNTKPLLTVIFALLGCAIGLFDFIRNALKKRN
ncbi:MAG: AtpZ/AtpI family protein [Ignavibacteria bacterium]|nr:AtpZ/AtpI family protein [Ignavibacteria bacterium]